MRGCGRRAVSVAHRMQGSEQRHAVQVVWSPRGRHRGRHRAAHAKLGVTCGDKQCAVFGRAAVRLGRAPLQTLACSVHEAQPVVGHNTVKINDSLKKSWSLAG